MKITIESTSKLIELDTRQLVAGKSITEGVVPARIWEGHTEAGVRVICFVTRVLVHKDETPENMRLFETELAEQRPGHAITSGAGHPSPPDFVRRPCFAG